MVDEHVQSIGGNDPSCHLLQGRGVLHIHGMPLVSLQGVFAGQGMRTFCREVLMIGFPVKDF